MIEWAYIIRYGLVMRMAPVRRYICTLLVIVAKGSSAAALD